MCNAHINLRRYRHDVKRKRATWRCNAKSVAYHADDMIDRPVFLPQLGAFLVELRDEHGWKQSQAADVARRRRITLSYNTLRWLEEGRIKNPDPDALRAIAKLYGVSYEEVVRKCVRESFGIRLEATESEPRATADDFVRLPLLATAIAAGQPLAVEPDPERDSSLAFRTEVVRTFTRPLCLRLGPRERSMVPTILPGDAVLIDQNVDRRRHPRDGHLYLVNLDALPDKTRGGAIRRIETSNGTLILTADHPDKVHYPAFTSTVRRQTHPDILAGEVVWVGRDLGRERKR